MSRNQVTITVSGGDIEENRQLSSMVHACLQEKGFTNASINALDMVRSQGQNELSIFDLVRSMNPEVYDKPIMVVGETDEDIRVAETAAMDSLFGSSAYQPAHGQHHPGMYRYN